MHVLIADDNPINARVIQLLLKQLGHTWITTGNGREALEATRTQGPFSVVLMDVQMPEMDGIEATRRIRSELVVPPPVIGVTANAYTRNRNACMAAGMADFLTKPVKIGILRAALEGIPRAAGGGDESDEEIDFEHFDAVMDGGDEELLEIFEDFCRTTPEMLEEMEALRQAEDADGFCRHAHQLKGSCATFGMAALSAQLGDLEQRVRSQSLSAVGPDWLAREKGSFAACETRLRQRL